MIASSEIKSNLNDYSIGFANNSSYAFCVGIIPLICFGILKKKWLIFFAICFFFCYQLSIIVNVPNLLGVFFVDVDNLFDTYPKFTKRFCNDLLYLV